METKMEDIDQLIKDTLNEEEAKFYDQLEEQTPFQMIGGLFKGKNKWFIILINIIQLFSFLSFVYCLIQFLEVTETKPLIKWGFAGFLSIFISSLLKIFGWLQMDKNALTREIKRLELQISSLAGKMGQ